MNASLTTTRVWRIFRRPQCLSFSTTTWQQGRLQGCSTCPAQSPTKTHSARRQLTNAGIAGGGAVGDLRCQPAGAARRDGSSGWPAGEQQRRTHGSRGGRPHGCSALPLWGWETGGGKRVFEHGGSKRVVFVFEGTQQPRGKSLRGFDALP